MFKFYLTSLSLIDRSHDYLGFLYCACFQLIQRQPRLIVPILCLFFQTFANNAIATWAGPIMTILVAISALGSLSAHIMTSSRLCFVGARKGHIPTCLSLVSVKHSTPEPALIFLVSTTLV